MGPEYLTLLQLTLDLIQNLEAACGAFLPDGYAMHPANFLVLADWLKSEVDTETFRTLMTQYDNLNMPGFTECAIEWGKERQL
jgi:hypothetical protein